MKARVAAAVGLVASQWAGAASLSAVDILQQFNLVTLSNVTSTSHVDGRSFIGGNVSGGEYAGHPGSILGSSYSGLTVMGNASGVTVNSNGLVVEGNLSNSTVNSGASAILGNVSNTNLNGAAYVAGTVSASNLNGGSLSSVPNAVAAATSTDMGATIKGLSTTLSHLSSTGSTVNMSANTATFSAVANSLGVAVFDLTAIDTSVFSMSQFSFNLNGANAVIFNVDEKTLNIASNFLAGSAAQLAGSVIWNFYNATSLNVNAQFGGVVLAPYATLTNNQNIEGTVLVNKLNQNAEIHAASFTGGTAVSAVSAVPELPSYALFFAGLVAVAGWGRRRMASDQSR
ncbi:choice-of-anchor A family protein [Roseateles koreensis]|uniref:Choice-of-anchor A family protein n=1 Tax=Roseateles koreensis TaxID=2987526 RepID=A0ABT5KM69_9BURK|nr:choice-of-anchor A family protein [Roseateles koreensis]MDC8784009.1 choice-of-anchor A family protein [Roseateles koreensis]